MNPYKARKFVKAIAIVIVVAMIVTSFSVLLVLADSGNNVYGASTRDEYIDEHLKMLNEYIDTIELMYKDEVDYKELMNGAFDGMVDSLGDPFSVYYSSEEEGMDFVNSVNNEFSGIGVTIEMAANQPKIADVIADGPAARAGIQAGDIIVKIGGVETKGKSSDDVIAMLRGENGTKVTLVISRDGKQSSYTLTREKISAATVSHVMLEGDIGYIRIKSFGSNTDKEFSDALTQLKTAGMKGLTVDIRNNGGGVINSAVEIADMLIDKGKIVNLERRGKALESISSTPGKAVNVPVVMLVNGGTASASEILAGAVQDNKAATIVGTKTYGKGIAQNVMAFKDGSMLKLSTMYFLTPNNNTIDKVGITPDYVIGFNVNADPAELMYKYLEFAPMSEKVVSAPGAIGLNVYGAQQRLSLMGYDVSINGVMDEKMVAAVKQFQSDQGLYSYGVLDFTTMDRINAACVEMISGTGETDKQMDKAMELLKAS